MKIIIIALLLIIAALPLSAQYYIAWVTVEPDTIYDDNNITYSEIEVCIYDEFDDPVDDLRVDFDCNLGNCLGYDFTNVFGIAETTFWESNDGPGIATVFISVDDTILGEVEITILPVVSAGEDIPLLVNVKNYPNPFRVTGERGSGTTISFSWNNSDRDLYSGLAEISIFNVKGQLINSYSVNVRPEQMQYSVPWDGKDRIGRSSEPGIYLYLISIKDKTFKGKMTLLK